MVSPTWQDIALLAISAVGVLYWWQHRRLVADVDSLRTCVNGLKVKLPREYVMSEQWEQINGKLDRVIDLLAKTREELQLKVNRVECVAWHVQPPHANHRDGVG